MSEQEYCRLRLNPVIQTVIGLLVVFAGAVQGAEGFADDRSVEAQFARAADLHIVRSLSDLPMDVTAKLRVFTKMRKVADLGEPWVRAGEPDDPQTMAVAQHLFSGVSDSIFFVLLQTGQGAWGARSDNAVLLLGNRGRSTFCSYDYPRMEIGRLRLDSLQADFDERSTTYTRPSKSRTPCTPHQVQ